jgi:glycogen debranching enzyme
MNAVSPGLLHHLERLQQESKAGFDSLRIRIPIDGNSLSLYHAGKKGDKVRFGLFGRDLLTTSLMVQETQMMQETIHFACATLGRKLDPVTGEEPGRGIHEFSPFMMRGRLTHYNAAEVSLLLLIVAAKYWLMTADDAFIREEEQELIAAMAYLRTHMHDGLFLEDPQRCGAEHYALRATYWKDSTLPGHTDPEYPVAYTLVQAEAIAALRAAAKLADPLGISDQAEELCIMADKATEHLFTNLWDERANYPLLARDRTGKIYGISSDALHMLAYLQKEDIPPEKLAGIVKGARQLTTPYGYRTYAPGQIDYSPTAYHLGAIWPFEQAFIARGAIVHELPEIFGIALRTIDALEELGFAELYYWDEKSGLGKTEAAEAEGCDLQLWSLAVPGTFLHLLTNGA